MNDISQRPRPPPGAPPRIGNGTNFTGPDVGFQPPDGVLLATQGILFASTFVLLFLFILFRKKKEMIHRGILPYLFVVGMWFYLIQRLVDGFSFLRTLDRRSYTHQ